MRIRRSISPAFEDVPWRGTGRSRPDRPPPAAPMQEPPTALGAGWVAAPGSPDTAAVATAHSVGLAATAHSVGLAATHPSPELRVTNDTRPADTSPAAADSPGQAVHELAGGPPSFPSEEPSAADDDEYVGLEGAARERIARHRKRDRELVTKRPFAPLGGCPRPAEGAASGRRLPGEPARCRGRGRASAQPLAWQPVL